MLCEIVVGGVRAAAESKAGTHVLRLAAAIHVGEHVLKVLVAFTNQYTAYVDPSKPLAEQDEDMQRRVDAFCARHAVGDITKESVQAGARA